MNNQLLSRDFYLHDTLDVARKLLGTLLVSKIHGPRVSGFICETEAYIGEADLACHARSGKTKRNAIMYGHAGVGYVYFTYGMHWMFNCVTGRDGFPSAVLIRAIKPVEGLEIISGIRSPIKEKHWCDGPAKLTVVLGITGEVNGVDLCDENSPVMIEKGIIIQDDSISATARLGIQNTPEPWKSKPWRFAAGIA